MELQGPTLEVFAGEVRVFASDRHWLHPLLDLAGFLAASSWPPGELEARDRVVGRAAALVLVHLGIGSVRAGILSRGGREVLDRHRVPYAFAEGVERVGCQTEELLAAELDPAAAYRLVRRRAGLEG